MMTDLTARVLNSIPAGAYEINGLLSLLRIEETSAVQTASVSCERRPVLRINPAFVREHCRSDEHLFLLVMHELHHVLLGHTRLFPRATRAHNMAFDAVINAMLVMRFPGETYRSFFLDLYGDTEGALRLLAPPRGAPIEDAALDRLHHMLYESHGVTAEEVFNAITEAVSSADLPDEIGDVLLGDHGNEEDWGTTGQADPGVVEAIRKIVEKWPPPEAPIRGRSLDDVLKRTDVRADRPAATVLGVLRRALLGAARNKNVGATLGPRTTRFQDALPTASDRHASVLRAAGGQPLLHWRDGIVRRGARSGLTQVYLDVSGSMDQYIPALYGGLAALRQHVEPNVLLFSTRVREISLEDLRRGRVDTTGGTDLACVLREIQARRSRKVLLVTDGYVGAPTQGQIRQLRAARCEVRVLLTPDGWRDDLEDLASRMDELPPISGDQAHD
jgi:hypothetical protein